MGILSLNETFYICTAITVAITTKFAVEYRKVQSALNVDTPEKKAQETFSLHHTGDFFKKMVILDGSRKRWVDEDGVIYIGVIPFLLEDDHIIDRKY